MELTPLENVLLTDGVLRATAPGPMQKMAARGLAPLPPPELLAALYMLAEPWRQESEGDPLPDVAADARRTAGGLPDGLLSGVLAQSIDTRIIHFFARQLTTRPKLLQIILFNKATDDTTFALLASACSEAELTIIARNESRLLRSPSIIAALYLNARTPMSLAIRAVELAIRNEVVVDVPAFDEIKASLIGEEAKKALSGAEDQLFSEAIAEGGEWQPSPLEPEAEAGDGVDDVEDLIGELEAQPNDEKKKLKISELSIPAKLRLAMLGNAFARSILIRDSNRPVAMAAITSQQVTDNEVIKYAANRSLSEDVIRYIANRKSMVRLYPVKVGLCFNPKTPLAASMQLLNFLTIRDLRIVAKSKGVPGPLVKAAAGLLSKKQK
jgi:hypothetical protein